MTSMLAVTAFGPMLAQAQEAGAPQQPQLAQQQPEPAQQQPSLEGLDAKLRRLQDDLGCCAASSSLGEPSPSQRLSRRSSGPAAAEDGTDAAAHANGAPSELVARAGSVPVAAGEAQAGSAEARTAGEASTQRQRGWR